MDIKIENEKEFMRQKEKYIYDSNEYAELRVLVGHGDAVPISRMSGNNVDEEDLARLICATKLQLAVLIEKCPEALTIADFMQPRNLGGKIKFDENEGNNSDE